MENNPNKKNKFIENLDLQFNKQPYYEPSNEDNIKPLYNTKNKSSLELKDDFNPYDYDINYFNGLKKDTKEYIYYSPYNQEPGRGFGNLNINNSIRNSESSRININTFKLYRESEILDRFEFIDNRYMTSSNIVFPYPRSGDTTRKSNTNLFTKKINNDKQNDILSNIQPYNEDNIPNILAENEKLENIRL